MAYHKDDKGRKIIWNETAKKWKYPNGKVYNGEVEEPARDSNTNPVTTHDHFKQKNKKLWWKRIILWWK